MSVRVEHGDSRDVIKALPDASIDAVVTDPPYALVSIQKRFGKPGSAAAKSEDATGVYKRASAGFMGQQWDTGEVAFDPAFWADVLRVMKPGAHLLAFSGTRTYHRMACAIEDAGFEIRDQIGWLYGSGFPKSHDVSKGIDKAAGAVGGRGPSKADPRWQGRNPAALSGGRVALRDTLGPVCADSDAAFHYAPATDAARQWQGWGTALKPAWEPIVLARKPLVSTVAANVLEHGTGAINIDGCRIESEKLTGWGGKAAGGNTWDETNNGLGKDGAPRPVEGRWPANVIHDGSDEVLQAFAAYGDGKGAAAPVRGTERSAVVINAYGQRERVPGAFHADTGTAARFFYSAKADADDRLGSKHPTVKPVDLMAYLCRLITPPGGTVLDPFAGSGTTGMACMREGFDCILIEREAAFVADINRRLQHVRGEDTPLFAGAAQ